MARTVARRERLEARITKEQKELFQHAADLSGTSLTEFVVRSLEAVAAEVIEEREVIKLSPRASVQFVEALQNPPEANDALRSAIRRYRDLTGA